MKLEFGCSRMVLLTRRYAIKFPNVRYRYPAALWGMLHNLSEAMWWKSSTGAFDDDGQQKPYQRLLCPVLGRVWLGFCIVMPRAEQLDRRFDCPVVFRWLDDRFCAAGVSCPAELKVESFGILNGEIVAIDYA